MLSFREGRSQGQSDIPALVALPGNGVNSLQNEIGSGEQETFSIDEDDDVQEEMIKDDIVLDLTSIASEDYPGVEVEETIKHHEIQKLLVMECIEKRRASFRNIMDNNYFESGIVQEAYPKGICYPLVETTVTMMPSFVNDLVKGVMRGTLTSTMICLL